MTILSLFLLCTAQQIRKHTLCCASHRRNTAAFSAHDVELSSQNMLNELGDGECCWTNEPFPFSPFSSAILWVHERCDFAQPTWMTLDTGWAQCKFLFSSSDPQVSAANKQSTQSAFVVKIFKPVSERNHGGSREVGRFELTQSNGASELKHNTVIYGNTPYTHREKSFWVLALVHVLQYKSAILRLYSVSLRVKPMNQWEVCWLRLWLGKHSYMPHSFVPTLRTNWCRKSKHCEAPAGCNPMPKSLRRG